MAGEAMTTVAHLLNAKGSDVWSVPPDATVYKAIEVMADRQVGALLVIDAGQVVGIVSERDYARKVILQGKQPHTTLVREIMTDKVLFVRPEQTIEDCMAVMTARRIRHLPVMQGDHLLGIISIGDIVKGLMTERDARIDQLEQYITGRRA
jgi:CBS domain-containing protein